MFRWIAAALAILVLSVGIRAAHLYLSDDGTRHHHDPATIELNRQIETEYEPVPLARLLASPERYEGRKVRVEGFVALDFEDSGLHADKLAYISGLRRNAIWLHAPGWRKGAHSHPVDHRYAEVAGTFDDRGLGYPQFYSGELRQVRRIEPTYTAAEFQQWRLWNMREVLIGHFLSVWFLTLWGWFGLWAAFLFRRAPSSK